MVLLMPYFECGTDCADCRCCQDMYWCGSTSRPPASPRVSILIDLTTDKLITLPLVGEKERGMIMKFVRTMAQETIYLLLDVLYRLCVVFTEWYYDWIDKK